MTDAILVVFKLSRFQNTLHVLAGGFEVTHFVVITIIIIIISDP